MKPANSSLLRPGRSNVLTDEQLDTNTELYRDLKAKHFVYDESSSPLLDVLATKVRTKFDHIMRRNQAAHFCRDPSLRTFLRILPGVPTDGDAWRIRYEHRDGGSRHRDDDGQPRPRRDA